jgi:Mg-chelatase subunit ChlD
VSTAPSLRSNETGAVALTVALALTLLVSLCFLLLHYGMLRTVRRELQNAADSIALAGAISVRDHGLAAGGQLDLGGLPGVVGSQVTRVPFQTTLEVRPYEPQGRVVVEARLTAEYQSPFNPFSSSPLLFTVSSFSEVHQTSFGDRWPVTVVLLDASGSMGEKLDEDPSVTLFQALASLVDAYATNPFPVRTGVLVFNSDIVARVEPPPSDQANAEAIRAALASVRPRGSTDLRKAFDTAAEMLAPFTDVKQRSAVLISDGKPTAGGRWHWPSWDDLWPFDSPKETAMEAVRRLHAVEPSGASVFTIETRPKISLPWWIPGPLHGLLGGEPGTSFMIEVSGGPYKNNDPAFYAQVTGLTDVQGFLAAMSYHVCRFGPLEQMPGAGGEQPDPISVHLRAGDSERPLLEVENSTSDPHTPSYAVREGIGSTWVVLSMGACYELGRDASARVVIRWGQPRLTLAEH